LVVDINKFETNFHENLNNTSNPLFSDRSCHMKIHKETKFNILIELGIAKPPVQEALKDFSWKDKSRADL
jgi:hypothetical protein